MSWTPIHARIHTLLKAKVLLPKGTAILMAVSGGQDSLCLAKLLVDLQPKWDWRLGLVHCDHGWRADSADNAAHVVQLAQQWQLPYFVEVAPNLPATEAAARTWRYGVFAALAYDHGYGSVVTGHTATDRAETVLYNLLRGSGADGIQSLRWHRSLGVGEIDVVRPLLPLTRQETGGFCRDLSLPVWEDGSNHDVRYRRNRIRQELMPYLRSHFNPKVEATLAQTAEIFTAEVAYLEDQARQIYGAVIFSLDGSWQISRQLRDKPLALQRRVIRRLLQVALPQKPSFDHIEKLVALLHAPNRSQCDPFPGEFIARVDGEMISLMQLPEHDK